ncbi:MAG: hypothetical protein D6772_10335 [Bacteroidetes bacterium]|nr:MAG: hypothetical protein D6772_10335 [Bacteroidota bacterium]
MTEGQSDEIVENFERFQGAFASGAFTSEEQARILALSRAMTARRLTVSNHLHPFFGTVVAIKEKTQSAERFAEWLDVYRELLANNSLNTANKLSNFLNFSWNFYERNALRYSPNSTSWFAFTDAHQWSFFEQPQLKGEKAQLTAIRNDDTLLISQTNFTYFPLKEELIGRGGRTTWERTALGREVYVDLEQYTVNTKMSIYQASKASLTYPDYFGDKKIRGSFSDKLVSDESRTSYPRFDSDDKYLNITNVGDGIRLRGAFRLQGATVYAVGSSKKPAELLVLNDLNQPRFQGEGNLLTVRDQNRIVGDNIRALIYLGADSLFHPSVSARLDIAERKLRLTRGNSGADRNPFFHSLHRMNVEADYIEAFLEEDSLVIGRPTATFAKKKDVIFESLHYYNASDYHRLQNIANTHPMVVMKAVARQRGNNYIPAAELAQALNARFTVETLQPLLYELVAKGFIYYDPEEQMIQLREKLFHYVDADLGLADFDYLRLVSKADSINATIDLSSGYTLLGGLEHINFSFAQKVGAKPAGQQALLKGNRNIEFDGDLYAGFTVLRGKDFKFNYEDFNIRLDSARFLELYLPTGDLDENNQPVALSIGSRLEHLRGYLLVDAPNNKSGRKDIPIFPSLQSKDTSFVFYDSPDIRGGVYDRDSIYFAVWPFSMDNLDKLSADDVEFDGVLRTNGMFPDIEETLVLQEDQSLGFQHETPTEGYSTYEGRGTYTGELSLSNQGVEGRGKLEYLAAKINAEDFLFMPSKATASAEAFDLEEDRNGEIPVPKVHGEVVAIEWRPFADSLIVKSDEAPFELYQKNDHQMDGTLVLTPEGLRGSGELSWSLATASSKIFTFGANSAVADTMSIRIKALEIDDRLALETDNVDGALDFDEGVGRFEANDEAVVTTLPYNQYLTTMNEFDWDMNGSTIRFDSEEGQPALFTSIHPDQDSLAFRGEEATYNLANSLLQIIGVERMVSADAFIYPDSQYVEISPNAEMATLENARIVADTVTEYHVINRATVNVKGRREYEASGFYEYNVGPHEQEIELQNIVGRPVGKGAWTEKKAVTRATGEVSDENDFYIDHKTQFQGTISLDAESPTLHFDGYARINAENLSRPRWFRVSFEGDKNNLVINYDKPQTDDDAPTGTGLFLSKENAFVYTSIMKPLIYRKDRPILDVSSGVFTYLEDKDQFVFGDSAVVVANDMVGNKMVFDNTTRRISAEGRVGLGTELRYISVDAAGRLETQLSEPAPEPEPEAEEEDAGDGLIMLAEEDEAEMTKEGAGDSPTEPQGPPPVTGEFMFGAKMIVPNKLLDIVYNDFQSASFEARPIGYLSDVGFYQKTVKTLFPPSKERDDALAGLSLGFLDFPAKINPYTFLFAKLPMRWHQDYQSFVSTQKHNGLVSINGKGLNKSIECYVEMKMPSADGDDRLYIYLKSPSGLFYFFGFKEGILSITSNNTVFMQELNAMKDKDLIQKMDDGETYEIQAVEPSSANIFYRRITAVQ